jgi:hypothetical protein
MYWPVGFICELLKPSIDSSEIFQCCICSIGKLRDADTYFYFWYMLLSSIKMDCQVFINYIQDFLSGFLPRTANLPGIGCSMIDPLCPNPSFVHILGGSPSLES